MASDVELVVGARNEAKDVLDELGQQLRDLSIPAEQGTHRTQAAIAGLISYIAKSAAAMTGMFSAVIAGSAGVLTATAVKSIRDEADAIESLNRQLDNYVGENRIATSAHKEFADEVRKTLRVSQADTLALMEKASALGVSEDKLDDAALAAIGLSKALGIDLQSALSKAINGDDELVSMTDSVNRGLREQREDIGQLESLWAFLQDQTQQTISALAEATKPAQDAILAMGKTLKESAISGVVGLATAIEVFRGQATDAYLYVGSAAALMFSMYVNDAKHAFTVAVPAYIAWFAENFVNLATDAFNAVLTIATNFHGALVQLVVSTWDFIASGGEGGIEKFHANLAESFASLLDGFEATTEPLPKIIERQLTDEEVALSLQMGELGRSLGERFSSKFAENMESVNKLLNPEIPQLNSSQLNFGKDGDKKSSDTKDLNATEGRLLTRGPGASVQTQLLAESKQQTKLQEETNKKLDLINQAEQRRRAGLEVELLA